MIVSSSRIRRAGLVAAALAIGFSGLTALTTSSASATAPSPNQGPFHLAWSKILGDAGHPIALSSPSYATLDSRGPAMIVGDRAGLIYAYHLSDGSPVPGWPVRVGAAVDTTVSVTGSGPSAAVYVGVGNSANPRAGGYVKITAQGRIAWYVHPKFLPSGGGTVGVQSSLAIGNLQGPASVIGGAMGQMQYALDAATGRALKGFPWFEADTNFATPALADLFVAGRQMIIEGGDSTAGYTIGRRYVNGGHLRILSPTGNAGTGNLSGGLFCSYDTNQVVQSSPAVGKVLAGARTGIVFGTGSFYPGASSTNVLTMVNDRCKRVWSANLGGSTGSSPALADNLGTGELNVIEAVKSRSTVGVFALHGSNGAKIWHTDVPGAIYGSVSTVSLNGVYQDVLVPTTGGLYILDGRSGRVLYRIWQYTFMAMQSTPLVTVDPDGSVGLTIAGYKKLGDGKLHGAIDHYKVVGAPAAKVNAKGSWPMFHHDVHLTGNASVTVAQSSKFTPDAVASASNALTTDRGAAARRVCYSNGSCVIVRVAGETTNGAANLGLAGYGASSVTVDPASPGASKVANVRIYGVIFGKSTGWLTHSVRGAIGATKATLSSGAVNWVGGCNTIWQVQMSYMVYFKDGSHASGTLRGPGFPGFHC